MLDAEHKRYEQTGVPEKGTMMTPKNMFSDFRPKTYWD